VFEPATQDSDSESNYVNGNLDNIMDSLLHSSMDSTNEFFEVMNNNNWDETSVIKEGVDDLSVIGESMLINYRYRISVILFNFMAYLFHERRKQLEEIKNPEFLNEIALVQTSISKPEEKKTAKPGCIIS
jgi:hypothetical protein